MSRFKYVFPWLILATFSNELHAEPITVLKSTTYIVTPYAVTHILPGGKNTPFTGIPIPELLDADSIDVIAQDFTLPALNTPVIVPFELTLLNEKNIAPLLVGGREYDFYFIQNPHKKSFGKLTIVQTRADTNTTEPVGFFLRETNLELLAILVPKREGQASVTEVTVPISSPVPIPFTFTPGPEILLKPGLVGDVTANWHTNKGPNERDMFSLGGMLQVPLGGRPQLDSDGAHPAAGGTNKIAMRLKDRLQFNFEDIKSYINNTLVSGTGSDGLSVVYNPIDGRVSIKNPQNVQLTAVEISSGDNIFVNAGDATNLQGPLDKKTSSTISKIGVGELFTNVEFGAISRPGLDLSFLLRDLSARALTANGTAVNRIGLELSGR